MEEQEHRKLIKEGLSNEDIIAAYILDGDSKVIDMIRHSSLHVNESIQPINGREARTLLNLAIEEGNYIAFLELIKCGAFLDAEGDHQGNTPLITAIESGSPAIAKELIKEIIESKEELHKPNFSRETPLHVAVQQKDIETARLLIESNAPINSFNDENQTPLDVALDIIEELTKQGE